MRKVSGSAVRTFLRRLVMTQRGATTDLAERIAERGAASIRDMYVRPTQQPTLRGRRIGSDAPRSVNAPAEEADKPATPVATTPAAPTSDVTDGKPGAEPLAAVAFDPYAFAIEALLIRQGEAALADRLNEIRDPAHLKALAKAQRISLEPTLVADPAASPEALRQAILRGAGKRIADRRAAAG
jgi:hypothetical protein